MIETLRESSIFPTSRVTKHPRSAISSVSTAASDARAFLPGVGLSLPPGTALSRRDGYQAIDPLPDCTGLDLSSLAGDASNPVLAAVVTGLLARAGSRSSAVAFYDDSPFVTY
ncbi:YxD-tail cyclophane-containing RiPP peptide [Streptomyces sp. NBC_01750]|uniref:YxD-tail cyclophane-containing RiPP peptide n=1 Tax=Streptomyces sp. NBC_01750 TaxID=2975928 RepID=UPI003FA38167